MRRNRNCRGMHLTQIVMILCFRGFPQAPKFRGTTQGVRIMAKSKRKAKASRGASARKDAIALLKADHRQVEQWFEQFEKARNDERKLALATNICNALKVHTTIEE